MPVTSDGDDGEGVAEATERVLQVALTLRELVVPSVSDPDDLIALALACPALLASPALRRVRDPRGALVDALVRQCSSAAWSPDALLRFGRRPFSTILLSPRASRCPPPPVVVARSPPSLSCLCGEHGDRSPGRTVPLDLYGDNVEPKAAAARVALLAARVAAQGVVPAQPALAEALAALEGLLLGGGPPQDTPLAEDLALACRLGAADAVRVLAAALRPSRTELPSLARIACGSGDGARVLRVLAEPPLCLGHNEGVGGPWARGSLGLRPADCDGRHGPLAAQLLCAAAAADDVGALAALAAPPYSLGRDEALLGVVCSPSLLVLPCACGSLRALRALALPPFSLGPADVTGLVYTMLRAASRCGRVAVLDALARPPWRAGHAEAAASGALCAAANSGAVAAIRRLAQPPYSLAGLEGPGWTLGMPHGRLERPTEVLLALAEPPYGLGRELLLRDGGLLLLHFVEGCDERALAVLAGQPFCLTRKDVRRCRLLGEAAKNHHTAAVDQLAREPFRLGRQDALYCHCLRKVCLGGRACMLDRLAQPPYCLAHEDLADIDARVLRACWHRGPCGEQVIERLAEAPYLLAPALTLAARGSHGHVGKR
eukprot:m51a1_g9774 hypothetical protein (604) ;mRNA; f:1670050-1671861